MIGFLMLTFLQESLLTSLCLYDWFLFPLECLWCQKNYWKAATYTLPWSPHSPLPPPMGPGSVTFLLGILFALRCPLLKFSWLDCPLRPGNDKTGFWVLGAGFQTWSRQTAARERFLGALLSVFCISHMETPHFYSCRWIFPLHSLVSFLWN